MQSLFGHIYRSSKRVVIYKYTPLVFALILIVGTAATLHTLQTRYAEAQFIALNPARYEIPYSLRFTATNNTYFNRTMTLMGSTTKWTFSTWYKNGGLGANGNFILDNYAATTDESPVYFSSTGQLCAYDYAASAYVFNKCSTAVLFDPTAWVHVMVAVDTTQATAANRVRMYVNGVEITVFSTNTNPSQNAVVRMTASKTAAGVAYTQYIGKYGANTSYNTDALLAQTILVDGTQLGTSTFGYFDANGYWRPREYIKDPTQTNPSFGTNGFFLDYASSTALGFNLASSSRPFTSNNFTAADQMIDTPSHAYASGNSAAPGTYSYLSANTKSTATATSTYLMTTGKWYWEVTPYSTGVSAGVMATTGASVVTSVTNNTTMGFAFDADAGTLSSTTDGTTFIGTVSGLTGGRYAYNGGGSSLFIFGGGGTTTLSFDKNAGGLFRFTPPSGYKALSTINLPEPTFAKPNQYFDAKIRTGTGASYSVSGLNFQPDFVWIKGRSGATSHALYDSSRGVQADLLTDTTGAETTQSTGITAFNSTGYSAGALAKINTNAATYVDWFWKESATAGMDIVTYTGDNTSNRDISHNLGAAPELAIVKRRDSTSNWWVWEKNFKDATTYALLNSTAATSTTNTPWGTGSFNASTFRVTNDATNNANASAGTYVAYLFRSIDGYSQVGSFVGNGSVAGPYVYLGFKPKYLMIKNASGTGSWTVWDGARSPFEFMSNTVAAESSAAELTTTNVDFLSTGFKVRFTNTANNLYVYYAVAEIPLKYSAENYFPYFSTLFYGALQTLITVPTRINGALSIIYNLSKGSGTFVIDHPLDPKNKLLYHSFVESPEAKNIYDGIATLDEEGKATITLPNYFLALNKDFRYLGTPIGTPMPSLYIAKEVKKRFFGLFGAPVFTIKGGEPNGRVSWQVTGVRNDLYAQLNPSKVEVDKGPDELVPKGQLLYPELYNADGSSRVVPQKTP